MTSFAVPFRQSIRLRLSLVIGAVIFLAVMAASAAAGLRELKRAAEAKAGLLEGVASAYAAALADPLAAHDAHAAFSFMRGVRELKTVKHFALVDREGAIFAQMGGGVRLLGRDGDLRSLSSMDLLKADYASVREDVLKGGERIGQVVLLADVTDLRAQLISSLTWTTLAALAAILGGVAIAQVMIARLTRPIRELTSLMAEVGAKQDFSRRVETARRRDESGVLGEAFNGMLGAINERDARIARHLETLEQTVEERTHDLRLAKEDAESANAAKSDFLATMSHEIRTPMNGMMVMAEMLSAADLSVRHRRYAEIISRSGASLLTIINDILDLSKIEAGKLDLEAVPFSPDALVEDVAALFWEKARSKALELSVYVGPNVPQLVVGDPTRFNQVVTNLVNNALKFTEKGGVSIDVACRIAGGKAHFEVAVADTGVGIEQHRIGAIFEAFSQADQSTTRRFGGTGLGLTVCRRLIEAMSGEIRVTSQVGKGSVFTICVALPVELAAPQAPNADGLKAAIALPPGQAAENLRRAFADLGARARLIERPAEARPGEIVLAPSDVLVSGVVQGALAICLSDVGDARADGLLRNRGAVDVLSLPVGRRALWDLAGRACRFEFRGVEALAPAGPSAARESFAGLKVLAADDNAVNREVLREALMTLDIQADFVENGEQAVAAAQSKGYDAIFMDGSMPVMDGFTATRLIRQREIETNEPRSRIIALTAQVLGADADAWAAAGADQHMTKPFTAARLVEALKAAQAGSSSAISAEAASAPAELAPPATPNDAISNAAISNAARPGAARSNAGGPNAARPAARPSLLDEEAIGMMEAIATRSGRDVLGKVWKLFLGQAPAAAAKLVMLGVEPIDTVELAKQAHSLKSMCLSAGAGRMAAVCETIEKAAKTWQTAEAIAQIPALAPMLEATSAEMQRRLASRVRPAAASG